ncbi:MAG: hypothetical protein SFY67_14440 [Candidatus Melainabacteria bacterium]|nr:hypothetical protein [Candidatus Melainabacteria bacterium]
MIVSETPQHVKDELIPGENITWIGQPHPKMVYASAIPFLIIALLGATYFFADIMKGRPSLMFNGVGLFFTAIGLLILFGIVSTPLKLFMQNRSTYYVVTNSRYLVISGTRNRKVETYEKKLMKPMMKMQILGLVNLVWEAPGNRTDSDGSVRKNLLWFSGIEPREIFNITSEEFPKMSELAKTIPPPR